MKQVPLKSVAEVMQNYLVPLAKAGIAGAVDAHHVAKGRGANAKSFGSNCWTFLEEQFRNALREGTIPFELADAQGCVLYAQRRLIHHYRVGTHEHEDIRGAFPRDGKLKLDCEANGQQVLPFAEKHPYVASASPAIFAFFANPKEGLVAAYCCEIGEIKNGKVLSWGRTIKLEVDAMLESSVITGGQSREPITLEAPEITIESKEETESAKRLSDNQ